MDISLLSRASLRPPTHHSDGGDLANALPPSWVLLDVSAYILNRRNSSTATCKVWGDKELQVTFFPAHPPRVSYFCVYCPGLKNSDYSMEPKIIATEGNLVLFRVSFGSLHEIWDSESHEYFIYRADAGSPGGCPLLEPIPQPQGLFIRERQIGLLSNDSGGYTIAALIDNSSASNLYSHASDLYSSASNHTGDHSSQHRYHFYIFSSKDKVWTIETVNLMPLEDELRHVTSKVITIGGESGTMAFVDLWRGILLFDVLGDDPSLRYIALPEISTAELYNGDRFIPLFTRDVAYVNGHIKFLEMTDTVPGGSKASLWSLPARASSQQDSWICHSIEVSKIRDEQELLPSEFMRMLKVQTGKLVPTMEILHVGHPTLSLDDDHIVYFMTKVKPLDKEACVVAVDMRSGTIQGAARFDAQRTGGLNPTYVHSRISSFLRVPSGNYFSNQTVCCAAVLCASKVGNLT